MAEKRYSGGAFLKKSSSGLLKKSSSVEILTGIRSSSPRIISASGYTASAQQLPNGSRNSVQAPAPITQQKSSPTNSVEAISQPPPAALPASASVPAVNADKESIQPFLGSLSSLTSQSSGSSTGEVEHATLPVGSQNPIAPTGTGAAKPPTPMMERHAKPISTGETSLLSTPIMNRKASTVSSIIGELGHVFQVTTEPPDDSLLPPQSPLMRRKKGESNPLALRRKDVVSTASSQGENEEGGLQVEPIWQRRLSQLFVPPNERDLHSETELTPPGTPEPEETHTLLPKFSPRPKKRRQPEEDQDVSALNEINKEAEGDNKRSKGKKKEVAVVRKSNSRINFPDDVLKKSEEADRLSVLDKIESLDNNDSSDEFRSSGGEEEEEEQFRDDYTSWDDTICSNRSAYFKMYYNQRGVTGGNRSEDTRSKASRASSHNSLSSLIREKMGRPQLPATKKTRADLGLMILVAVLFVIIVVGISLTSYFYNLHLLEMTIFSYIKFFEKSRVLEIYGPEWETVTTAHLGSNLPVESIPEDCTHYLHYLHKHNHTLPNDEHDHVHYEDFVCLDWTSLARLQLRKMHASGDVQCYSIWWVAAREDFVLRDCLKVGGDYGAWWGGGEMTDGGYPVTNANVPPTQMVTGKLGIDFWGQLLRRTWLSERASLLTLPDSFQGYVSVNHNDDGQVCLESRPHPHLKSRTPTLEYTLCTAPNISTLTQFMHQKAVSDRKIIAESSKELVNANESVDKEGNVEANDSTNEEMLFDSPKGSASEVFSEEIVNRVQERIDQPVWIPWMPPNRPELTQEAVLKYVKNIVSQDYGNWGHILLPPSWQARPGDLTFDPERFPDPAGMIDVLEKKGFRLALTIHPYVSVHAPSFNNGTQEGIWVRQSKSQLPALAQYNDLHPAVITDFSNPRAKRWFSARLKELQDKYKIDRFHLQPADAHALPAFHEYHLPLPGPDSVLAHFMASVSFISPPMSSEGAVTPPKPPTFLTLGNSDGSWKGLETLIPRILTLATLGYPLIDTGAIGGMEKAGHVPERELYMRWMEAATFLPAVQISVLPRMYGEEMKTFVLEYNKIRKEIVLPRLHAKIQDALQNGTSLVRPLALFAPKDTEAAQVSDEWILGNDLLVAPVTKRGERSRDIYIPDGIWKDEIDGHLRRGGRWIRDYKVPLTKIPHFTLKSIDDFKN